MSIGWYDVVWNPTFCQILEVNPIISNFFDDIICEMGNVYLFLYNPINYYVI